VWTMAPFRPGTAFDPVTFGISFRQAIPRKSANVIMTAAHQAVSELRTAPEKRLLWVVLLQYRGSGSLSGRHAQ